MHRYSVKHVVLFLMATAHVVAPLSHDWTTNRRDVLKIAAAGIGGSAYTVLVGKVFSKISRGLVFPESHERRVKSTISTALTAAAKKQLDSNDRRVLRVLEVGVGEECRMIRRGLYEDALQELQSMGAEEVMISGVDIKTPKKEILLDAADMLQHDTDDGFKAGFQFLSADVTEPLPFPQSYFDAVVCSLTLCSVEDQITALEGIKAVLKPDGGTFGYVEHVAVEPDEDYRFLDWQQRTLDPLQQKVASNCHLHRRTEASIADVFQLEEGSSSWLAHERFLVDDMWPVSCQCCGVIQRDAARTS